MWFFLVFKALLSQSLRAGHLTHDCPARASEYSQRAPELRCTLDRDGILDSGDWVSRACAFPPATKFRASYKRTAILGKGRLVARFRSMAKWYGSPFRDEVEPPPPQQTPIKAIPSMAGSFWECRVPGASSWRIIKLNCGVVTNEESGPCGE